MLVSISVVLWSKCKKKIDIFFLIFRIFETYRYDATIVANIYRHIIVCFIKKQLKRDHLEVWFAVHLMRKHVIFYHSLHGNCFIILHLFDKPELTTLICLLSKDIHLGNLSQANLMQWVLYSNWYISHFKHGSDCEIIRIILIVYKIQNIRYDTWNSSLVSSVNFNLSTG